MEKKRKNDEKREDRRKRKDAEPLNPSGPPVTLIAEHPDANQP